MSPKLLILALCLLAVGITSVRGGEVKSVFSKEETEVALKQAEESWKTWQKGGVHSVFLLPKLKGEIGAVDVFGNTASRSADEIGYFLGADAMKLLVGLQTPVELTAYDRATTFLVVPLMSRQPTTEGVMFEAAFLADRKLLIRMRIKKLGAVDFIYDEEFSKWMHGRMIAFGDKK